MGASPCLLSFPSSTSSAWRRTATVYAAVLARTPPTANASSSESSRSLLSPGCATLLSGSSPPLAVFAQLAVLSRTVLHPTVLSSPRAIACSSRVPTVSVLLVSSPQLDQHPQVPHLPRRLRLLREGDARRPLQDERLRRREFRGRHRLHEWTLSQ